MNVDVMNKYEKVFQFLFEQILEATPRETTAVRPLTSNYKTIQDEQDMWDTAGEARTNS